MKEKLKKEKRNNASSVNNNDNNTNIACSNINKWIV